MRLEILETLVRKNNPQASCFLNSKNKVCIVFAPNTKIYTYKGTIQAVAERLGVVPEVNIFECVDEAVKAFKSGQESFVGPVEIYDTLNYTYEKPVGVELHSEPAGVNEYGQKLSTFSYRKSLWI